MSRHHIWYTDFLGALRLAAESLIVARNLAEDGDGLGSELYRHINLNFKSAEAKLRDTLARFVEECCQCEGPNETYPKGFTCEAHEMQKKFRLSTDYKKGDTVLNVEGRRLNQHLPVETFVGRITSITTAPSGEVVFKVHGRKGTPQERTWTRELGWQQIELYTGAE